MKRLLAICTALCLCFGAALAAPVESQRFDVPGTAYAFALPDQWTITETGDDPASALLIANGSDMQLHLWLNRQNGWRLNDWKAALQKAAAKNGVLSSSFADETMAGRAFVSYRYERDGRRSMMFATELNAGEFLTFEFRTEGEFSSFDQRREEIDAMLGSLTGDGRTATKGTQDEPLSLLQAYPVFTASYGFAEYYDDLKTEQGGLFRNWSVRSKARLSEMLPALCEMEIERMKTFYPNYAVELDPVSGLMRQKYGIPDDAAISENEAVRLAKEWLKNRTERSEGAIDQLTASAAYLIDGTPQWAVYFYDKSILMAETRMDAYSGAFSQIDRVAAEQMVFTRSEALGAPSALSLHDLYARATYDFSARMWTFCNYEDPFDAGFNYHVDDVQMIAIPGTNG